MNMGSIQDVRNYPLFEIDVRHWSSFAERRDPSTHVSEPREVSCYSRNGAREITYGGREQLLKFSNPNLYSNLGDSFNTYVPKVDTSAGVEEVLTAVLRSRFDVKGQADVISYRNNLNKIGLTPYENNNAWELDATMIGNTVFLDIRITPENPYPNQELFTYYGYRFEALCTGTSHEPVNPNAEFCSVSRIRIANHRILLASEIDCTLEAGQGNDDPLRAYVELKTMKMADTERARHNMYRHRYLKFWLQSYLAGVRHIFLGYRSENGQLLDTTWLRTSQLPGEARKHFMETRSRQHWIPNVCIDFLDYALGAIRHACQSQPEATIRVVFDPRDKIVQGFRVGNPGEGMSAKLKQVWQSFDNPQAHNPAG